MPQQVGVNFYNFCRWHARLTITATQLCGKSETIPIPSTISSCPTGTSSPTQNPSQKVPNWLRHKRRGTPFYHISVINCQIKISPKKGGPQDTISSLRWSSFSWWYFALLDFRYRWETHKLGSSPGQLLIESHQWRDVDSPDDISPRDLSTSPAQDRLSAHLEKPFISASTRRKKVRGSHDSRNVTSVDRWEILLEIYFL